MPKTTPLTDEQRASILDMQAEGATRRDIALAHGVSLAVVSKIVKAAGRSFPGNNGTRAATIARQFDLADWHEQKALELLERESAALDTLDTTPDDPRARLAAADKVHQLREKANHHSQAAERLRYAVVLREIPDDDWPHLLRMMAIRDQRGRAQQWECDAVAAELRRRSLSPMIRARIAYELSSLAEGT